MSQIETYITANGLAEYKNKAASLWILTAGEILAAVFPKPEEVEICKTWIELYGRPKKAFGNRSSYVLKHVVERWAGEYVTNGAFIEAARQLGYEYERIDRTPNAVFKMALPRRGSAEWHESRLDGSRPEGDRAGSRAAPAHP
jgi:hypothetical protein